MGAKGLAVPGIESNEFEDLGGRIRIPEFRCGKPLIVAVNGP
jgi:hypothetical protein